MSATPTAILRADHPLVTRAKAAGLTVGQQTGLAVKTIGCPDCDASGYRDGAECGTCGADSYLRYDASAETNRQASINRIMAARTVTNAAVAAGKCPACGAGIVEHPDRPGWWACRHFREPGLTRRNSLTDAAKPSCSWSGVTGSTSGAA